MRRALAHVARGLLEVLAEDEQNAQVQQWSQAMGPQQMGLGPPGPHMMPMAPHQGMPMPLPRPMLPPMPAAHMTPQWMGHPHVAMAAGPGPGGPPPAVRPPAAPIITEVDSPVEAKAPAMMTAFKAAPATPRPRDEGPPILAPRYRRGREASSSEADVSAPGRPLSKSASSMPPPEPVEPPRRSTSAMPPPEPAEPPRRSAPSMTSSEGPARRHDDDDGTGDLPSSEGPARRHDDDLNDGTRDLTILLLCKLLLEQ